jgi:hypothetical protein
VEVDRLGARIGAALIDCRGATESNAAFPPAAALAERITHWN